MAEAAAAVSVCPSVSVPLIVGTPEITGAVPAAAIVPVGRLSAVSDPLAFVSVWTTVSVAPTSAATNV